MHKQYHGNVCTKKRGFMPWYNSRDFACLIEGLVCRTSRLKVPTWDFCLHRGLVCLHRGLVPAWDFCLHRGLVPTWDFCLRRGLVCRTSGLKGALNMGLFAFIEDLCLHGTFCLHRGLKRCRKHGTFCLRRGLVCHLVDLSTWVSRFYYAHSEWVGRAARWPPVQPAKRMPCFQMDYTSVDAMRSNPSLASNYERRKFHVHLPPDGTGDRRHPNSSRIPSNKMIGHQIRSCTNQIKARGDYEGAMTPSFHRINNK